MVCRYDFGQQRDTQLIKDHIEKYIGPISSTIHGLISDPMPIDIQVIHPTSERNFYTLITSGMSNQAMTYEKKSVYFSELILALPPSWRLDEKSLTDHNYCWPIKWLIFLSQSPHHNKSLLWENHIVLNGENPVPFAQNTDFCASIIAFPKTVPVDFILFTPQKGKTIVFFAVYPLYYRELIGDYEEGCLSLLDNLDLYKVTELIDLNRVDTAQQSIGKC